MLFIMNMRVVYVGKCIKLLHSCYLRLSNFQTVMLLIGVNCEISGRKNNRLEMAVIELVCVRKY